LVNNLTYTCFNTYAFPLGYSLPEFGTLTPSRIIARPPAGTTGTAPAVRRRDEFATRTGAVAYPFAVPARLSPRLAAIVNALSLQPHSRVLEIGCGPGAAARAVAARLITGHILAIDRSATAIAQAGAAAVDEITSGRMSVRHVAAEEFVLEPDEEPYDIVFAVRVGALDGRHPQVGQRALRRIAAATKPDARLFIDGGDPLRELVIPRS
jgi:SAM-dependent methyltransferase